MNDSYLCIILLNPRVAYDSLNTSLNTTAASSHQASGGDGGCTLVENGDNTLDGSGEGHEQESCFEEAPMPTLAAATALIAVYANDFVAKRDFNPSHIHPAVIGYSLGHVTNDNSFLNANPSVFSPIFLGGNWYDPFMFLRN